jgi:hypothetical protein
MYGVRSYSLDYNVLFAEKDGTQAHAQITAFENTWKVDYPTPGRTERGHSIR